MSARDHECPRCHDDAYSPGEGCCYNCGYELHGWLKDLIPALLLVLLGGFAFSIAINWTFK